MRHFHIFSLSYNLTSDDLWPLTSSTNGGGVPMLHLWPNFGWNPSKHVEVCSQMLTRFHNNKWFLCVFPAKTGDTPHTQTTTNKQTKNKTRQNKNKNCFTHHFLFRAVRSLDFRISQFVLLILCGWIVMEKKHRSYSSDYHAPLFWITYFSDFLLHLIIKR